MIHHWRLQRALRRLQEGSLPDPRRRRLDDHLARCPDCRERLRRLEESERLLAAARPEAARLSPDAARAVLEGALAGARSSRRAPRRSALRDRRRAAQLGAAGLAFTLILAALSLRLIPLSGRPHPLRVAANDAPGGAPVPSLRRESAKKAPMRTILRREMSRKRETKARKYRERVDLNSLVSESGARQTMENASTRDKVILGPSLRPGDDLQSLNADPEKAIRQWASVRPDAWQQIEDRVRKTIRVRDDFVTIPFPRIASTSDRAVTQAVESYKRKAAIVDPRLSHEVTCAVKATALSDLCEQLKAETGIQLSAGPSVADQKVTLFCERQPLREVMGEINRLFGFTWLRSGEPGKYYYELVQDLRSQLLEEELRNQDRHAAMLALDQQMAAYQPYLSLSMDELKAQLARATGPEKELLQKLSDYWGPVQVYHRLTPAQHLALLNGEQPGEEWLQFSIDAPQPDRRLPAEWRQSLLESNFITFFMLPAGMPGRPTGDYPRDTPVAQLPGAMPTVNLQIDRSELGQLALKTLVGVYFGTDPTNARETGLVEPLAVGQNPSAMKPDNAGANHELQRQPLFQRLVSFRPQPSCPRSAAKAIPRDEPVQSYFAPFNSLGQHGPEPPHVSTADVWEAVHRATGLNILADSYSHFYPIPPVIVERRPLFEGLSQVGDALGVRWKKEGDFLVCRSASFFWDDLKEVPNRYLVRWQEDKRKQGGLPLEDLLQMAGLTDQQLDSTTVGNVIEHCWGLDEWWLVGKGAGKIGIFPGSLRSTARFLARLTPAQRRQAERPDWLAFTALTPAQQEALVNLLRAPERAKLDPHSLRFQYIYAPAGSYVWETVVTEDRRAEAEKWPMVVGKTREEALAAARRLYAPASPDQILPSQGVLWLGLTQADGQSWGVGRENVIGE